MRRQLTQNERGRIAEKIMELGNLIFIGLIVYQLVPKFQFNLVNSILAILVLIISYAFADWFMRGGNK